jgi:hypothetical protein
LSISNINGSIGAMTTEPTGSNLPAQIADAISGVPKALIPASIKALDRLIGAAVDIPVAWLGQKKAKIDAQTQTYAAVELAISNAVSTEAGATPEIVQQAMNVLVRKEYRKQINRNAVGQAALEDLRSNDSENVPSEISDSLEDDWLNIFERYAEDASTERMQMLWGRVLSGEIRNPGTYSLRTLRFLSEFSQADALTFANFCECAFGFFAPKSLVKSSDGSDIKHLLDLEAAGLIKGASGPSLTTKIEFGDGGLTNVREGNLAVIFKGNPGVKLNIEVIPLTPLGEELLSLIPSRKPAETAKRIADACRSPEIEEAFLAKVSNDGEDLATMEIFWQKADGHLENRPED